MERVTQLDRPKPEMTEELAGVRNAVVLLAVLFAAKAAAVVLFLLPSTSLAGETGFLAWLGQNYALRVCLLVVTGTALYGTLAAFALASLPTAHASKPDETRSEAVMPLPAYRPARDARTLQKARQAGRMPEHVPHIRRPGQG
ncbi:MAG: hypothetical protein AAFV19_19795 [Pseudomonadota bacterium]